MRHFRPAIGARLTGLVALLLYALASHFLSGRPGQDAAGQPQQVLAVLAFGYSAIQDAITQDTNAAALILLMIALGKIVTTGLTIGSGGSGGVFGPSMVIGGCGGGALGIVMHNFWPGLVPHPASFVIVGMAGFFAAAAKTPFSTLIMVSELTGGYALLLPSLWVCTLCFVFSDEKSIYASQVEGRSRSPAHQGSYVRQILAEVRVSEFLSPKQALVTLHPNDTLATVIDRLSNAQFPVLAVVDAENRLLGVVNLEEVHIAAQQPSLKPLILVEDLMRSDIRPLTPDDTLDQAQELFVENDLLALPVVDGLRVATCDRDGAAVRCRQRYCPRPRAACRRVDGGRDAGNDMTGECDTFPDRKKFRAKNLVKATCPLGTVAYIGCFTGTTLGERDRTGQKFTATTEYGVLVDSSPDNQAKYYPHLKRTSTHNDLYYVGPREKEQFLAYLNGRLRDKQAGRSGQEPLSPQLRRQPKLHPHVHPRRPDGHLLGVTATVGHFRTPATSPSDYFSRKWFHPSLSSKSCFRASRQPCSQESRFSGSFSASYRLSSRPSPFQ